MDNPESLISDTRVTRFPSDTLSVLKIPSYWKQDHGTRNVVVNTSAGQKVVKMAGVSRSIKSMDLIELTSQEHELFQNYFKGGDGSLWETAQISKVYAIDQSLATPNLRININPKSCNYCIAKGDNHTQANIWFSFKNWKLRQACFSLNCLARTNHQECSDLQQIMTHAVTVLLTRLSTPKEIPKPMKVLETKAKPKVGRSCYKRKVPSPDLPQKEMPIPEVEPKSKEKPIPEVEPKAKKQRRKKKEVKVLDPEEESHRIAKILLANAQAQQKPQPITFGKLNWATWNTLYPERRLKIVNACE